jgi:hypothetical protein
MGVKVDYIGGTSMGAIIGGLYATGYTGKDIENIILNTDFYNVLSSSSPRQQTSFFSKNVDKYLLKIPIQKEKLYYLQVFLQVRRIWLCSKNYFRIIHPFRTSANYYPLLLYSNQY